MKINHITFLDIATAEAFGPISLDGDLRDIGRTLGTPRYWEFSSESFFSGYMGFGAVEVHFRSISDVVRVCYAEIQMYKFKSMSAPFFKNRSGEKVLFQLPIKRRALDNRFMQDLLLANNIAFSTEFDETVMEDTSSVIKVGKSLRFYFSKPHDQLEVISIS